MIFVYIVFAVIFIFALYIVIKYSINTKKIKAKKVQTAKKEEPKKDEKKTDVKSDSSKQKTVFLDENPKDSAWKQANESSKQKEQDVSFSIPQPGTKEKSMTELEKEMSKNSRYGHGLEKSYISVKHMSSETNTIGEEGPSQSEIAETNKEILQEEKQEEANQKKPKQDIGTQIENTSDDVKKILVSDVLKRKY